MCSTRFANDFARRAVSPVSMRYAAIVAYRRSARWTSPSFLSRPSRPLRGRPYATPSFDAALVAGTPRRAIRLWIRGAVQARVARASRARELERHHVVRRLEHDRRSRVRAHPIATAAGVVGVAGLRDVGARQHEEASQKGTSMSGKWIHHSATSAGDWRNSAIWAARRRLLDATRSSRSSLRFVTRSTRRS